MNLAIRGGRELIGRSAQIEAVRRLVEKASRHRLPVLLLGESGTGKEVVARAIHNAGPCGQFVPIDCGALVGTLMESELFGHVKGSFSGAAQSKRGLVELADGGTAFFDEIGDLPLEMQVKLLRLVQEREFRAVGALEWRMVDLRVISATHRDLKEEVAAGRFRQDLYYRLNVFPIHLPPLRERKEDIPLLISHFLETRRPPEAPALHPPAEIMELLISYDWPGNVRELEHCVSRMAAMQTGARSRWPIFRPRCSSTGRRRPSTNWPGPSGARRGSPSSCRPSHRWCRCRRASGGPSRGRFPPRGASALGPRGSSRSAAPRYTAR